jgi:hypothetical protein
MMPEEIFIEKIVLNPSPGDACRTISVGHIRKAECSVRPEMGVI